MEQILIGTRTDSGQWEALQEQYALHFASSFRELSRLISTRPNPVAIISDTIVGSDTLLEKMPRLRRVAKRTKVFARLELGYFNNVDMLRLLSSGVENFFYGIPDPEIFEHTIQLEPTGASLNSKRFGKLRLSGQELKAQGKTVKLTRTQALIMRSLLKARGEVVFLQELKTLQGYCSAAKTHTVETHITRLRRACESIQLDGLVGSVKVSNMRGYALKL